ncbi:MAG: hypothetical protein IT373_22350 [Polyangiaceae bacterium]|nr:hypothetical protein [Polyangiaceae bacterium]
MTTERHHKVTVALSPRELALAEHIRKVRPDMDTSADAIRYALRFWAAKNAPELESACRDEQLRGRVAAGRRVTAAKVSRPKGGKAVDRAPAKAARGKARGGAAR